MMMGKIEAQNLQWYAVRVVRKQVGGIRAITVGGEFETYRDRQRRLRKRRVNGTGDRVFLPEHILRRAGFEVFLPIEKVLRRKNRFSPEQSLVSKPKLVDWLFVGWPVDQSRWHQLMALDVVTGVMGTGGRPVTIPQARIIRLMRQWGGGELSPACYQMVKAGYAAGDVLRVPDGPFAGFDFTVVDVSEKSARGLVSIFGRDTPLDIPLAKLPVSENVPAETKAPDRSGDDIADPRLVPCGCGHQLAEVVHAKDGYCISCGNCGRRAAVGSRSEGEAIDRWNAWRRQLIE
ncbi:MULTISPECIES: transcription termination/antitermination NusG family protein [Phaeobacter]|uniref:transcription termination/antitermination NusG family protein n=1 Tax=Phaeobacter TaxID=302485 RepID=UPI0006946A87|nr:MULTISPECIES: transcription termination/antitermination NusG family protein [Phaeobacter]AUQ89385.1 transcription antitermination protein NusG [Phaeobacter inhibens]